MLSKLAADQRGERELLRSNTRGNTSQFHEVRKRRIKRKVDELTTQEDTAPIDPEAIERKLFSLDQCCSKIFWHQKLHDRLL